LIILPRLKWTDANTYIFGIVTIFKQNGFVLLVVVMFRWQLLKGKYIYCNSIVNNNNNNNNNNKYNNKASMFGKEKSEGTKT
jgi:hypothetical protein